MTLLTKRTIPLMITFLISFMSNFAYASEYDLTPSNIIAESAVLINQDSGQVIFDKNMNEPMYPASTTKVLTAIIILESHDLNEIVTIDPKSPYAGGSHIALEIGEQLTVEQLLYALMITSANDAAEALAVFHSGSIEAFAQVMNEKAAEMGAINSNFVNPHGLPNPDHLTTAYDLAMIGRYAMNNETFRKIVKTVRYEIPPTNLKGETRYLNSTNSFYQGMQGSNTLIDIRGNRVPIAYEYVTGIKRGYTDEAQYCLVTSAENGDKRYVAVVLRSTPVGMYSDTRQLIDLGLFGLVTHTLHEANSVIETISMNNTRKTLIPAITTARVVVDLPKGVMPDQLEKKINILPNIELPVKKSEALGSLSYYYGDTLLTSVPLVSQDDFAGEDLVNNLTQFFGSEKRPLFSPAWFLNTFARLLIALLLWRTIMTAIRLKQLKKRQKKRTQRV